MSKTDIESTLNLFPEVVWDRWGGIIGGVMVIFGWIERKDGKSDFLVLLFRGSTAIQMITSSADNSVDFSARLDFGHSNCNRVENYFFGVNCIRSKP